MTQIIVSENDASQAIMYVEYRNWMTGVLKTMAVLIDSNLVEALRILGNFHPRVKQKPEDYAPVLRRRHPIEGGAREVRLPVAVVTLSRASDPVGFAADIAGFLDEASIVSRSVAKAPRNGLHRDCRLVNWVPQISVEEGERIQIDSMEKDLISQTPQEISEVEVGGRIVTAHKLSPEEIREVCLRNGLKPPKTCENLPEREDAADRILNSIKRLTPQRDPSQSASVAVSDKAIEEKKEQI